jgi:hypothetical protein
MGDYVDSFGLVRYVGRGEGVDNLYDASAKPAEGMFNSIEVKINGEGIGPNVGTAYDRGQAVIPAGSVLGRTVLFVEEAGNAANVELSLVKKDGSAFDTAIELTASAISPADATTYECNNAEGTQIPVTFEDGKLAAEQDNAYVKMSGTVTGLKGVLKIEYV